MIWELQITSVICTANEVEAGRVSRSRVSSEETIPLLDFSSNSVATGPTTTRNTFSSDPIVLAR